LFFGKDFLQIRIYVSPLLGFHVIIRLTQGGAALALDWYVAPRWGFCRFAAVDLVDGVDVVDGGYQDLTLLAFLPLHGMPYNS
jgi:hypothetical protein